MSLDTEDQHPPSGMLPPAASTGPHSAGTAAEASAPADASAYYAWDAPDGTPPEEEAEEEEGGWTGAGVAPFQVSGALPVITSSESGAHAGTGTPSAGMPPVAPTPRRRRFPGLKVLVIGLVILVILAVAGSIAVFAQTTPPLTSLPLAQHPLVPMAKTPVATPAQRLPGQTATPRPMSTATPTPGPVLSWVPTTLPAGWAQAGLSLGDAVEAERTAVTFTDREMSLDSRSLGTRAHHGGTLTAATFLLTPGGQQRFAQNDVRVIDNALFDSLTQRHLIQEVIPLTPPRLVQFTTLGGQQMAWVDVSFQLLQSTVNPQTQQRVEGLERDPATQTPRTHHLVVVLVRVPPGTQGANPPMGGTGWLVSTYALDAATLPTVVQPI